MASHDCSPLIKRVLRNYQNTAQKGLHGPSLLESSYDLANNNVGEKKELIDTCCKETRTAAKHGYKNYLQMQALHSGGQEGYLLNATRECHYDAKTFTHRDKLDLANDSHIAKNMHNYDVQIKKEYPDSYDEFDKCKQINDCESYVADRECQYKEYDSAKCHNYDQTDDASCKKKLQEILCKKELAFQNDWQVNTSKNLPCQDVCVWPDENFTPPSPGPASPSPPSPPPKMFPLALGSIDEYGFKDEVIIDNMKVASFKIGGEHRICFPQLLYTVLMHVPTQVINQHLHIHQIHLQLCSNKQLECLKEDNIIPPIAISCGLIRYSDAVRLMHNLHVQNSKDAGVGRPRSVTVPYNSSTNKFMPTPAHHEMLTKAAASSHLNNLLPNIIVSHNCFGKCRGWVYLSLYKRPDSRCIQCVECLMLFSTEQFVCHAHRSQEVRMCHWGFDVALWRHYLQLASDQPLVPAGCPPMPLPERAFDTFKNKFDDQKQTTTKHKQVRYISVLIIANLTKF